MGRTSRNSSPISRDPDWKGSSAESEGWDEDELCGKEGTKARVASNATKTATTRRPRASHTRRSGSDMIQIRRMVFRRGPPSPVGQHVQPTPGGPLRRIVPFGVVF